MRPATIALGAALALASLLRPAAAHAQTFDPATQSPTVLLAAPPDGVAYFERRNQAFAAANAQKWSEAEPLLEQVAREYPRDGLNWVILGNVEAKLGKFAQAAAAYEKAGPLIGWGIFYNPRIYAAAYHLAAGDRARALDLLRQEVFGAGSLMRSSIWDMTEFTALRTDPEFQRITGHVDLSALSRDEGWRRDVDFLYEELARTNPDYRGRALPAEVTRRYEELKRKVPQLSNEEIYVGMGRMLAPMHAGHTNVFSPPGNRYLPVRFYLFPDGLYVMEGDAGSASLVGSRVVGIGKLGTDDVLKRVGEMRSTDGDMEHAWGVSDLAETGLLKGVGAIAAADTVSLAIESREGARRTVRLATLAEPRAGRQDRMVAPAGVPAPLYLSQMSKVLWEKALPEQDALYVQVNNLRNDPGETIAAFGKRLWTVLSEGKQRFLILDLRHNNGGVTNMYPELLRTLVAFSRAPDHQLYALIGRRSYSATGNFISDLERLTNPIFVGEASSECCSLHGDPSTVTLPYSKVKSELTAVRWNLSRNAFDGRREMSPHVPVQLTAADYFTGKDPALDAVFRLIAAARKP